MLKSALPRCRMSWIARAVLLSPAAARSRSEALASMLGTDRRPEKLQVRSVPSIHGPRRLRVGNRVYNVPSDLRLIRCRDRAAALCFLIVGRGSIRCLSEHGEVDIPMRVLDVLYKRFIPELSDNDPLFYEDRAAFRSVVWL